MMCGYAMCLIERIGRKTCRPAPSWVRAFAKIVLFRLLTFFLQHVQKPLRAGDLHVSYAGELPPSEQSLTCIF